MIKECVKQGNFKIQKVPAPKDLRVVKTKEALFNALLSLLEKQPLWNLSITELCKEARVSRTVFYNYYATPEDVFEENLAILMEKSDKKVREQKLDVKDICEEYLEIIKRNKILFKEIYNMPASHPFIQYIYGIYFQYWTEMHPKEFANVSCMFKQFVVYGHIGLMTDWIAKDCEGDVSGLTAVHSWFVDTVLQNGENAKPFPLS